MPLKKFPSLLLGIILMGLHGDPVLLHGQNIPVYLSVAFCALRPRGQRPSKWSLQGRSCDRAGRRPTAGLKDPLSSSPSPVLLLLWLLRRPPHLVFLLPSSLNQLSLLQFLLLQTELLGKSSSELPYFQAQVPIAPLTQGIWG